jgi:hypothetical protein
LLKPEGAISTSAQEAGTRYKLVVEYKSTNGVEHILDDAQKIWTPKKE